MSRTPTAILIHRRGGASRNGVRLVAVSLFFLWLLVLPLGCSSLKVIVDDDSSSRNDGRFRIVHNNVNDGTEEERTLFHGGEFAAFVGGKWCRPQSPHHTISSSSTDSDQLQSINTTASPVLELLSGRLDEKKRRGRDDTLGPYTALVQEYACETSNGTVRIITTIKNFDSNAHVMFQVTWPDGAWGTSLVDYHNDDDVNNASSSASSMAPWPVFHNTTLSSVISWHTTFFYPIQSLDKISQGSNGGPVVFYNDTDASLSTVVVASVWNGNWKSFSTGDGRDWKGDQVIWAPGTSGRIQHLDKGYTQSVLLHAGTGIANTLYEWGTALRQSRPTKGRKLPNDVTLQKIGYQTDNGAYYCFCQEKNCSKAIMDTIHHLKSIGIPMGYLSFQGAGSSSGRGSDGAPWCVDLWGIDGGLSKNYPVSVKDMQQALGIPLQLYAPYFCPDSPYFRQGSKWTSVKSNCLPRYDFQNVSPRQSRSFYGEFFDRGLAAGMVSFESDFMVQNYNCVPEFVHSTNAASIWQHGMADAAEERNITIQWCMATPSDALASVDLPAVTNFRVSSDYCDGYSWIIGISSLLAWALGIAPSKDTLWTTNNNRTATPGCPWVKDHETPAAELHLVLALMSTGPVGISDGIRMSNATLIKRAIATDGTLLKPAKPITAIDSSFLGRSVGGFDGFIFGTAGYQDHSWHFVSFKLQHPSPVRIRDFWPPVLPTTKGGSTVLAYRFFHQGSACSDGSDAISSGCVKLLVLTNTENDPSTPIFVAPKSSFDNVTGGSDFAPAVATVWKGCQPVNNVILLGELDKYVPLSPARITRITCTTNGVNAELTGSAGEVVALTALQPIVSSDDVSLGVKAEMNVVVRNVTVPTSGRITVRFETPHHANLPLIA